MFVSPGAPGSAPLTPAKVSTVRPVPAWVSARAAPKSARIDSADRLAETLLQAGLGVGVFYIGERGMNVVRCFH